MKNGYPGGSANNAQVEHVATSQHAPAAPQLTQEQYNQLLSLIPSNTTFSSAHLPGKTPCFDISGVFSRPWIICTGATHHMTYTSDFFITKTFQSSSNPVRLPDGTHAPITHIGTLSLSPDLSLSNVLCVPSLHHNLFSGSALAKDLNCSVIFYPDHCVLQDLLSKRKIGLGKLHGGLYILEPTDPSVFVVTNSDSIDL